MSWQQLIPANTGGGRQSKTPSAKLSEAGAFVLNLAAVKMLLMTLALLLTLMTALTTSKCTPTIFATRDQFLGSTASSWGVAVQAAAGGGRLHETATIQQWKRREIHGTLYGCERI